VAISGDGFAEAIAIIVAVEDDMLRIRTIEWGRP
jgi:hypothetical protein